MAGIFNNTRFRPSIPPSVKWLIYINVAVFIAIHLMTVVLMLFNITPLQWQSYIELPSNLHTLLYRIWTLFTYMFVHVDIWHILFNMLWLYWFGSMFVQYFTPKHLTVLYVLGGLAGAVLYLISYNTFPYFANKQGLMCGASAAIMAIVFATTVRIPNYRIGLLFIGEIPLKYIAGVIFIIDLLSMTSLNAGGHFAHIGGAIMGAIFGLCWNKGKDITSPIHTVINFVMGGWRRPKIRFRRPVNDKRASSQQSSTQNKRTQHARPETDGEYRARKKREAEEIDNILDKIKKSGYSALTPEEKQRLFDARKN